jgi:hypothetical protein
VCRAYGKLSHWAKEYRSKGKTKMGQAQMAEEEEGSLMLMEAVTHPVKFKKIPNPATVVPSPVMEAVSRDSVHLIEEKVFAHLGEEE